MSIKKFREQKQQQHDRHPRVMHNSFQLFFFLDTNKDRKRKNKTAQQQIQICEMGFLPDARNSDV